VWFAAPSRNELGPLAVAREYNMAKAPTPVTKTAWLPSKGYDYMRATRHKYVKAIEASIPGLMDGTWEDIWQYIYACENTGVERVWGYASRDMPDIPYAKDN
jgi:hypothetical protein